MDSPLCLIDFVNDFFRAGKLFVARHLAHGCAKARGGKRRQGKRVEVFGPGLGAQRQANGRVRARLSNALPQGKELFGGYNDALLIEEPWRQTCILKHGGHTNSQLLQSCRQAAGNSEVFAHGTQPSFFREAISMTKRYLTSDFWSLL